MVLVGEAVHDRRLHLAADPAVGTDRDAFADVPAEKLGLAPIEQGPSTRVNGWIQASRAHHDRTVRGVEDRVRVDSRASRRSAGGRGDRRGPGSPRRRLVSPFCQSFLKPRSTCASFLTTRSQAGASTPRRPRVPRTARQLVEPSNRSRADPVWSHPPARPWQRPASRRRAGSTDRGNRRLESRGGTQRWSATMTRPLREPRTVIIDYR